MITRAFSALLAAGILTACQPTVPEDSNFGVGFDQTFDAQRARRDAQLSGATVPAAPVVTAAPLGSDAALAADTARILAQTDPNGAAANSGIAPVMASPANPAPAVLNSAGISQENNFDAVAGRRSIEADAARVASNRAQYQVVQPQALPPRGASGPNVVAYALSTSHPVGTQRYSRFGFNKRAKAARNCAAEGAPDLAQATFLSLGGPQKDPRGLDPDGDGYACDWSPVPFRRAAAAGPVIDTPVLATE